MGNTPTDNDHQRNVNIIHRPRSTGSILKPFLFAAALDNGELLPQEIIADVPTQISGYTPQNFGGTFEGAVPADEALFRSLNIPFVLLLQKYGVARFYQQLKKLKLSNINKHPDHYGLSLVLGGAESNLFELCQAYTLMAFELNYFSKRGTYLEKAFQPLNYYDRKENLDYGKEQNEKINLAQELYIKPLKPLRRLIDLHMILLGNTMILHKKSRGRQVPLSGIEMLGLSGLPLNISLVFGSEMLLVKVVPS